MYLTFTNLLYFYYVFAKFITVLVILMFNWLNFNNVFL